MNVIDKKPNYKEVYSFIKERFSKTQLFSYGPFDETFYSMRVYETAKTILKLMNRSHKKQQILVACILHDIGKYNLKTSKLVTHNEMKYDSKNEWDKHPKLGVPIAKKLLSELGHSEEFIEQVCYLVEHHDARKGSLKNKPIELQILQDADLVADIGLAGFIRPFLYGTRFKRGVIHTIEFINSQKNHFNMARLNLKESKIIAKERLSQQKELFKQTSVLIKSDLLD